MNKDQVIILVALVAAIVFTGLGGAGIIALAIRKAARKVVDHLDQADDFSQAIEDTSNAIHRDITALGQVLGLTRYPTPDGHELWGPIPTQRPTRASAPPTRPSSPTDTQIFRALGEPVGEDRLEVRDPESVWQYVMRQLPPGVNPWDHHSDVYTWAELIRAQINTRGEVYVPPIEEFCANVPECKRLWAQHRPR